MADQVRFVEDFGTPVIWGEAGASGVTNTITVDALASGSARMGASVDLGAQWDCEHLVEVIVETGTAPTAGGTVDVYLACSRDNTVWPGGVTGSDAAWPSDGNEDEWSPQLGGMAAQLIATNDGNVAQTQQNRRWRPKGRYVAPVIDNNLSTAFRDEATATNNDTRIKLTPIRSKGIDP